MNKNHDSVTQNSRYPHNSALERCYSEHSIVLPLADVALAKRNVTRLIITLHDRYKVIV
jgi:hypothetical protein